MESKGGKGFEKAGISDETAHNNERKRKNIENIVYTLRVLHYGMINSYLACAIQKSKFFEVRAASTSHGQLPQQPNF